MTPGGAGAAGRLDGRVAVVTGAGRGIGLAVADRLARAGALVVIGELDAARGEAAAAELRDRGLRAAAMPLDVTSEAACAALVGRVIDEYGRLDVLVNNAGLFTLHRSAEMPAAEWRRQIDVMLTGTFLCSQAAARAMIPAGSGAIVNVASIGGLGGWPMRAAYNAAKAGVIALTEVLATEWACHGLRVNAVSPGVTRTEMLDVAIAEGVADLGRYAGRVPVGRVAEVSEIAEAVLFLASDRAAYVNGANLRVDGGWVAWSNPHGEGFPPEARHGA